MNHTRQARMSAAMLAAVAGLWACAGLARAQVAGEKGVVVRADDGGKGTNRRPARRLLREGTFVTDRQGWLRPVGAERWAMVWDAVRDPKTGATTVDPPMAVLPCLKLMEMRRIVEARPETVTFRVSGRVLVYKGRNYLLPTFFLTLSESGSGGGAGGQNLGEMSDEDRGEARKAFDDLMGRSGAPGEPGGADANDPDAVLRSVDSATPNVSIPVAPTAPREKTSGDGGTGASMPRTGQSDNGGNGAGMMSGEGMSGQQNWKLVREGTMLTARRGRLLRGAMGEFIFAPDNGTRVDRSTKKTPDNAGKAGRAKDAAENATAPDAQAASDEASLNVGPMRLIPCLNLQEMERLTQSHAVPLEFKISGQVFVYNGRNYLLPTMYLIEADRDGNVTAGQ